ncbi:MAG: restriction endonuclease subunit S [Paraclostridium sp.]
MNKVPKLRFKEFSGDWESKKLGELGQSIIGLTYSPDDVVDNGVLVLRSSNIKNNKIVYTDNVFVNMKIQEKIITRENDILICSRNGSRGLIGKSALIDNSSANNAFGAFMTIFRADQGKFIFQLLQSQAFFKQIYQNLGATINQITSKDLNYMQFYVPLKEEQEKIASFFSLIDNKISLQREKVEMLKSYKTGMMQKIFSRELRFKDDDGRDYPEWKTHSLGRSIILYDNLRKPVKEQERSSGKYAYYGATGIIDYINDYIFEGEYLLLGEDGANIVTRNAPLIYKTNGKFWVNNHAHIFKPTNEFDIDFMKQCLERINYIPYNTGTAQPKLNVESIKSISFKAPILEEQKNIAKLLTNIDEKVVKEQMKLDSLNEYKKGLLQQMFA